MEHIQMSILVYISNKGYQHPMTSYVTRSIPHDKPDATFVERPWGSFKQYANNEGVTVTHYKDDYNRPEAGE